MCPELECYPRDNEGGIQSQQSDYLYLYNDVCNGYGYKISNDYC